MQSLVPIDGSAESSKFILSVVNSRLLSWYFCQINLVARRDDFPKTIIKQTRELPFPSIEISGKADKIRRDRLINLVDAMLALNDKSVASKSEAQKGMIRRQTDATDREIYRLVYELYGLTEDEIKIVEGETK